MLVYLIICFPYVMQLFCLGGVCVCVFFFFKNINECRKIHTCLIIEVKSASPFFVVVPTSSEMTSSPLSGQLKI